MDADRVVAGHPTMQRFTQTRAQKAQNRVADAITRFAGSMMFVYIHVVWFTVWIVAGVEDYPYGLLTMIVSLEAIFLSTFVLISQNRTDQLRGEMAMQEWDTVNREERQNAELLSLSNRILELTTEVRELTRQHVAQQR